MSEQDPGGLRNAIYARMEEISFRSGAVAAGGAMVVGGLAIAFVMLPGGHHAAATRATAAAPRPAMSVFSSAAPAAPSPSPRPPASPDTPVAAAAPPASSVSGQGSVLSQPRASARPRTAQTSAWPTPPPSRNRLPGDHTRQGRPWNLPPWAPWPPDPWWHY